MQNEHYRSAIYVLRIVQMKMIYPSNKIFYFFSQICASKIFAVINIVEILTIWILFYAATQPSSYVAVVSLLYSHNVLY